MKMNVKISIIIPVYNAQTYLRQSIDSAIAQTITPKEIICIDDGSTDISREILREYELKYSYIRIFTQENQGSGIARNLGLREAKGEFIAFLDADDFYLQVDALDKMYEACKRESVSICGSYRSKCEFGEILPMKLHRDLEIKETGMLIKYKDFQSEFHYQNYIFQKKILEENKIRFPDYRRYQDPPFFVKVMICASCFYVLPVELYCYREDEISLGRRKTYIADVLRGLIDNLQMAITNEFKILHNHTVSLINGGFHSSIVESAFENNFEVLDLLRKANSLVQWELIHGKSELDPLTAIKNMSNEGVYAKRFEEFQESHNMLTMWLCSHFSTKIEEYLKQKQIKSIAIYGYGFFGRLLCRELENSDIQIMYVIDRNKDFDTEIRLISPDEEWDKVDAIIISPLSYQDIMEEWKEKMVYPTYVLKNILLKLFTTNY